MSSDPGAARTLLEYLAPILAVIVGWFLHELSDTIKLNREDRRAVGKVLAELLELRHSIRAVPLLLEELRRRVAIPSEVEPTLRNFYSSLVLQMTAGLSERYNKAIDLLAGRLPFLAFELRSKDQLDPVLSQLRALIANDPSALIQLSGIEDEMRKRVLPRFDNLVNRLAWLHGWRTWIHARRRSQKADSVPPETREMIDSLFKNLVPPPSQNP